MNHFPKKEELELESNRLYEKANLLLSNFVLKPLSKEFQVYNYDGIEVEIDLEKEQITSKYSNGQFILKKQKSKQKALNISLERII